MTKRSFTVLFIILVVVVGVYAIFDPTSSYLAPKCIFKLLTGYDCPSCGGQRALHAILNGKVRYAFFLNPFLLIVTPYIISVAYSAISKSNLAIKLKPIVHHHITISTYLVLYIAWWIIRNTTLWATIISSI